eukprot:4329399-Amphidinium_carterae.1
MVCCLSWVFLGKPGEGRRSEVLCCQLNAVQKHAVGWLSDWTRMMAPPGKLIRVEFPRGRGLHGLVKSLGEMGGYGRTDVSHPAGSSECEGTTTVAYPIGVETASLPMESAKVELAKVLPSELFAMLSTEGFLERKMCAAEQDVLSLPRLCVRSPDWAALAEALVKVGLCAVGEDAKSPVWGSQQRHLRAGVFGVEKPDSNMLRLIVDRRRKNATEVGLRQGLVQLRDADLIDEARFGYLMRHMTLPHASQFTDLLLPKKKAVPLLDESLGLQGLLLLVEDATSRCMGDCSWNTATSRAFQRLGFAERFGVLRPVE